MVQFICYSSCSWYRYISGICLRLLLECSDIPILGVCLGHQVCLHCSPLFRVLVITRFFVLHNLCFLINEFPFFPLNFTVVNLTSVTVIHIRWWMMSGLYVYVCVSVCVCAPLLLGPSSIKERKNCEKV